MNKPLIKRWVVASLPYLFVLMLALVTYLMLIELPPKQGGWPHWDKVQHLAVFVMLTTLALLAFPKWRWQCAVGLGVYGALIEWMQALWTLTRMPSIGDWLADVAGVAVSLMLYRWMRRLQLRGHVAVNAQ